MKTMLIAAEIPCGEGEEQSIAYQLWRKKVQPSVEEKTKHFQGVETLGENVWLIDLESALHFQVWLIGILNAHRIGCRVAILDEPPKWIESPPVSQPKT